MHFHARLAAVLLSLALFSTQVDAFAPRTPANPNIRWVTAVVASIGMMILMLIILLLMTWQVVVFKRRNEANIALVLQSTEVCHDPSSPVPLLLHEAAVEKASRYVYFNSEDERENGSAVQKGSQAGEKGGRGGEHGVAFSQKGVEIRGIVNHGSEMSDV